MKRSRLRRTFLNVVYLFAVLVALGINHGRPVPVTLGYADQPPIDGCAVMMFVASGDDWSCLKSFLRDQGFVAPKGAKGEISGRGVRATAAWSPDSLFIGIGERQTYSCEDIRDLLAKTLADCRDLVNSDQGTLAKTGSTEVWRIDSPNVKNRFTRYTSITLREGDTVTIDAGGCVQTGGSGRTWKLYVTPTGPDSDKLYHGLIKLPGMERYVRIEDFMRKYQGTTVTADVDMKLRLGYEDDDYGDNGYWGHDDGTENQCKGIGNAWIQITITRH